ncbi:DUF2087 domain-containing protein [Caenispirillum bisanense]|uniref:DUF2087 domain-containing protein n=1 Tax=Caenispirillum bisanense TaxID=414052 RepID=UPI0031DBFC7F
MTRQSLPFVAPDLSALARSLGRDLAACGTPPGHVQLLNMLSRAIGFRNIQHLRAEHAARDRLERLPAAALPPEPAVDHRRVERAARHFDADGRLLRWPSRAGHRLLCLWALWARLPAGDDLSEADLNEALTALHDFGDYALLRRSMVDAGMLGRTVGGRRYWRIEQPPPAEALALIRHLKRRQPS